VLATLAGVLAATAAAKPPPPTPARAVALASPGVVFVQTGFTVHVRLKLSDESADGTYSTDYGFGSGFVVNPSGTIVTARHVVKPADADVRHYAANKLFGTLLDLSFPADADFFSSYTITDDPLATHRLRQCYDGVICTFQVTPKVDVFTGVALGGVEAAKGLEARILKLSEGGRNDTDIAVLQVDGKNMPTIALAPSIANVSPADEIVSLGFPATAQDNNVTDPDQKFGRVSRVTTVGTTKQVEMDLALEQGMSGGPVVNLRGRVIGVNSYYAVRQTGESGTKYARSVDDVRELLGDTGKRPVRGPVDVAWVEAVDLYFGHHYSAAIPHLRQVLALSPNLPLATSYLQTATAKAGTKEDIPLGGGGLAWWAFVLIAAGGAALAGALVVLLRRRGMRAPRLRRPALAAKGAGPAARTTASAGPTALPTLVVAEGGRAGERFPVVDELSLGRENADVVFDDTEVSRRHAVVRVVDGTLEISDAGSANGTFVNGSRIDGDRRLRDGDVIRVGQTTLKIELPIADRPPAGVLPALIVTDGARAGERFPVEDELSLGRENADVVFDDAEVSRRHAVVRVVDGTLEISDAGSANGTFVNGSRIDGAQRLAEGDVIRVGQTTLKVEIPQPSTATTLSTPATVVAPREGSPHAP
jgi:pSer/pThr/pTyr-binding forkhead associated (FHA) protein